MKIFSLITAFNSLAIAATMRGRKAIVSVSRPSEHSQDSGLQRQAATAYDKFSNTAYMDVRDLPAIIADFPIREALSASAAKVQSCLTAEQAVESFTFVGLQSVEYGTNSCAASIEEICSYLVHAGDMLQVDIMCVDNKEKPRVSDPVEGPPVPLTNDPRYTDQENLAIIKADEAWTALSASGNTPQEVVVAIVDSGIQYNHEDLINQMWTDTDGSHGRAFCDSCSGPVDTDPIDTSSHGTYCAGIAAAQINNSLGMAGVAGMPYVKLAAVKVLCDCATELDTIAAMDWIYSKGIAVSSHSYYSRLEENEVERRAFSAATEHGHLAVIAAGNFNKDHASFPVYPCEYTTNASTLICVAASNGSELASFSDYGGNVYIAAPGTNIISATLENDGYGLTELGGTSASAPHVAATGALLASLGLSAREIKDTIMETQTAPFTGGFGVGQLDVHAAVQSALGRVASRNVPNLRHA